MENLRQVQLFSEATIPVGSLDLIVEQQSSKDKPLLKIKGPFLIAEKRNGNGRLYRRNVLEMAVQDYYRDYITPGRALGELGHPDRFEPVFADSCIKIEKIAPAEDDPNIFMGEAIVLQSDPTRGIKGTGPGDVLASMLQYGVKPGVSSRGLGQMTKDKVIDEYYKLCAVDVVYNPSGPGCYVDGILESKQFLIDAHGEIFEQAYNRIEKTLEVLPKGTDAKLAHLKSAFENFIQDIRG
jgi:hypothetical protein